MELRGHSDYAVSFKLNVLGHTEYTVEHHPKFNDQPKEEGYVLAFGVRETPFDKAIKYKTIRGDVTEFHLAGLLLHMMETELGQGIDEKTFVNNRNDIFYNQLRKLFLTIPSLIRVYPLLNSYLIHRYIDSGLYSNQSCKTPHTPYI